MLPQKITNEYVNTDGVTRAATEVINGVEYEVFYLTDDNNQNRNLIKKNNENTSGNYRYVMTADWDMTTGVVANVEPGGNAVIWDLNGYTLRVKSLMQLAFYANTSELTDTSVASTGRIDTRGGGCTVASFAPCTTLIISGGASLGNTVFHLYDNPQVIICGGNYTRSDAGQVFRIIDSSTITYSPYLIVDSNGGFRPYDAYAVSTTPYATGMYNYAYGLAWEISVAELRELVVPTDKTYYLWGRDKDGWYQYLDLHYADGAWRNA